MTWAPLVEVSERPEEVAHGARLVSGEVPNDAADPWVASVIAARPVDEAARADGVSSELVVATRNSALVALNVWAQEGRVVLCPSADLVEALRQTDLPVDADIRMPFGAFYLPRIVGGRETAGAFLAIGEEGALFVACCIGTAKGRRLFSVGEASLDFDGTRTWKDLSGALDDAHLEDGPWRSEIEWLVQAKSDVLRLAAYLGSESADVERDEKSSRSALATERRGKKRDRVTLASHTVIRLGHRERFDARVTAASRSLDCRFVVRGHWRMQAHGPGRQLRKRVWIKPHWKGPDYAERVVAHTYVPERAR